MFLVNFEVALVLFEIVFFFFFKEVPGFINLVCCMVIFCPASKIDSMVLLKTVF